jgi:maleylpyruvate isomerase
MAPVSQPTGPHSVDLTIGRIKEATDRLIATVTTISDEQMRASSLLPGWSRGHVLTHIARNADGLRNLLIWAETGEETPQYASAEQRETQIETGAGRPATEIAADVTQSAADFIAKAAELSEVAWIAEVRGFRGPAHPAWFTLHRRLTELEVHHVDLAAGYGPADWPDWFVTDMLYRVTGQLAADPRAPSGIVTDSETGRQFFLRRDAGTPGAPDATAAGVEITGPGRILLAWLLGRDGGSDLAADPPGPLPTIPPF